MKFIIRRASYSPDNEINVDEAFKADSGNCSFVNINSMEELGKFIKKYGDIIVSEPKKELSYPPDSHYECDEDLEFFCIEIYDSYVE